MSNLLDSMARGVEGQSITKFVKFNGLPKDWKPDFWLEPNISAFVSGKYFDFMKGTDILFNHDDINDDLLVHLRGPRARCTVNLAVMFAMAAAYCRDRQNKGLALVNGSRKNNRRRKRGKKE